MRGQLVLEKMERKRSTAWKPQKVARGLFGMINESVGVGGGLEEHLNGVRLDFASTVAVLQDL